MSARCPGTRRANDDRCCRVARSLYRNHCEDSGSFVRRAGDFPESETRASSASESSIAQLGSARLGSARLGSARLYEIGGDSAYVKSLGNFFFRNPVSRNGDGARIRLLVRRQRLGIAVFDVLLGGAVERGKPVIVLMEQLGLVQGQAAFVTAHEHVSVKRPPVLLHLPPSPEQPRIVGHVEHALKADTPWVLFRFGTACFLPEYPCSLVHLVCDFHVLFRTENRTGARVGIEQREIVSAEREAPLRLLQLLHLVQEERELGLGNGAALPAQREKAKLVGAMHTDKHRFPVLEVIQADQP